MARLNAAMKAALPPTWVKGEIEGFRVWGSGHAYFSLKDERAVLSAVLWASDLAAHRARGLEFRDGLEVFALGIPEVWGKSGRLSFKVSRMEPAGVGALQRQREELMKRLAAEGLFDEARKRCLPLLPSRIGVVSSRFGAAFRDVVKVLSERFPGASVVLYPVRVQGETAPVEVERAIAAFSRTRAADVVIVARGGGSKEDLSAFDDERVVRAVAASDVPVISAVGHEVDWTLTDLAADLRAATPSQAAEKVVARRDEFDARISRHRRELASALRIRLADSRSQLLSLEAEPALSGFRGRIREGESFSLSLSKALTAAFRGLPGAFSLRLSSAEGSVAAWPARAALELRREALAGSRRALTDRLAARMARSSDAVAALAGRLEALSPLRILARGYAVARLAGSRVPLTNAGSVPPGSAIRIRLHRGTLGATVTSSVGEDEDHE